MAEESLTVRKVRERVPGSVLEVREFRGETTIVVRRQDIAEVARFVRDDEELRYDLLSDLSAVDWLPRQPRFEVNYHLYSMAYNRRVRLKVQVEEDAPIIPTVTSVWPTAGWHEREVYDLFGIVFTGHPDLRRILLPEDWEGHPLRKDESLGREQVEFTFNFEEIEATKPYVKE